MKSRLNALETGYLMYMPGGTHVLTPSRDGEAVTVAVEVDASTADEVQRQFEALKAAGKNPFFSLFHDDETAAFRPSRFSWDTRLDARGELKAGVWADGEWTRAGREAVEGKDVWSFSPTFFASEQAFKADPAEPGEVVCCEFARANMGAVENDPAFDEISPLWASRSDAYSVRKLIKKCHEELRPCDPDMEAVKAAMASKFSIAVTDEEIADVLA